MNVNVRDKRSYHCYAISLNLIRQSDDHLAPPSGQRTIRQTHGF